jgi:biotin carboxylase
VGYPLVVKPPAGAGAVATLQVDDAGELARALGASPPGEASPHLLEEFVRGEEHSLETISVDGRAVWHSLTRYDPPPLDVVRNPWIQWSVILPREVDGARYDDIRRAGARALEVLGMDTGLTHMEWFRRRDGSLAISEVAARPPGAEIPTLVSRAHDVDFLSAWARLMVFGTFDPPERRYAAGAVYLRGQGEGAVRAVHGLAEAERELGALVVDARLPVVGPWPTGSYEGEGYIVVRHPETAVVERAVQRLRELVRVELG